MDQNTAINTLIKFKKVLKKNGINVDKMILYGSYATNTQHEGSDIDVVIISLDFYDKDYWQRNEILTNASMEIFKPIEPIPMTPDEWENKKYSAAYYAENGLEL
jgi:uncharacterized protein